MQAPAENGGNSTHITVRRMIAPDVPTVLAILKTSPEASIWSEEGVLESVSQGIALAAEQEGRLAGILIGRVAANEFEILNLAVWEECRRRGIATRLVEYARIKGVRQTYLEVRASNEGGIAFYKGMGFQVCGRRPNYYRHPAEDAVLFVLHKGGTKS
jgi:[ribosomal protein S18]-alanine N-acetyltransferase